MCDSGAPEKILSGGLTSKAAKTAFSSDGAKRQLLTGGLSTLKVADSETRKDMLGESRDAGVLPDKKVKVDPAAERAAAAAKATQDANARIALQRRAMRENSLLTGGGGGRATLGV
jgi:hypothetical protein